jgi:hypothetical protein
MTPPQRPSDAGFLPHRGKARTADGARIHHLLS